MSDEEKERLKPHFKKEDLSFSIRCMTNRYGGCSGCDYYSLCNEEMSNNELSLSKENELPNNENGTKEKAKTIKVSQ
jgi:hypothetical protein